VCVCVCVCACVCVCCVLCVVCVCVCVCVCVWACVRASMIICVQKSLERARAHVHTPNVDVCYGSCFVDSTSVQSGSVTCNAAHLVV
jgi:hypothetical protein